MAQLRRSQIARRLMVFTVACGSFASCTETTAPRDPVVIDSIAPTTGFSGALLSATVSGSGFTDDVELVENSPSVSIEDVVVESETQISFKIRITGGAPLGARTIQVMRDGAVEDEVPFTVIEAPLTTLATVTPDSLRRDDSVQVTITGTGFVEDSTAVAVLGDGVLVTSVDVLSPTQLTAWVRADAGATASERSIQLTTFSRASNVVPFTVNFRPISVEILSSITASDTIGAALGSVLVEVKEDNGTPRVGLQLRFTSDGALPGGNCGAPCLEYLVPAGPFYTSSAIGTTDANGRASFDVRAGTRVGATYARVHPEGRPLLRDSALVNVLVGQPVSIAIAPMFAQLEVGDSIQFVKSVHDRGGNFVSHALGAFVAEGAAIQDAGNGWVRAVAIGDATMRAQFNAYDIPSDIGVVPGGRLVGVRSAYTADSVSYPAGSYLFDSDLSSTRLLTGWSNTSHVAYHVPTARLAFVGDFSQDELWVGDTLGSRTHLNLSPLTLVDFKAPAWTADGAWIYFSARNTTVNRDQIWRVEPDGTNPEAVGEPGNLDGHESWVSPSPDGTQIVYFRTHAGGQIVVKTLAGGDTSQIGVSSDRNPKWSPRGDWIAVHGTNNGAHLISPDNSQRVELGTAVGIQRYNGGTAWSPDGVWVAYKGYEGITLFNVDTDEKVTIPLSWYYSSFAWVASP